ncbi:hypothetical protein EPN87_02905, partial [archaeon]
MLTGYGEVQKLEDGLYFNINPKEAYNELGQLLLGTGLREPNAENREMITRTISKELTKYGEKVRFDLWHTTQGGQMKLTVYNLPKGVDPRLDVDKGIKHYLSETARRLFEKARKMEDAKEKGLD